MSADLDVDEWAPAGTVEDRLAAVETALAELAAAPAGKEDEETREPRFRTLGEFVTHLFSWYRREVHEGQRPWCRQWWLHPEAAIRLHALWLAFEGMRDTEPTWMSAWIRDHVDTHMPRLMSNDGPLGSCHPGEHRYPIDPLPADEPPPEWWTEADTGL